MKKAYQKYVILDFENYLGQMYPPELGLNNIYSNIKHQYSYYNVINSGFSNNIKSYLKLSHELEIKDTTESNASASYLDLLLSIGRDGHLRTSLYNNIKRDFYQDVYTILVRI